MRPLLVCALALALLTGCQSQPTYTDNGNPGQIKAVVFYDDNGNGTLDGGEASAQAEVGISYENSCPPSGKDNVTLVELDADGAALFEDLEPGKYSVALFGPHRVTTKLTQEVYVSSDAITMATFGIMGE